MKVYLKYLSVNEGLLEISLYKWRFTWNTSLKMKVYLKYLSINENEGLLEIPLYNEGFLEITPRSL